MGAWSACPPAIVIAWMPGQEDGNAAADVLFGDVNPAGRLPVTFPVKPTDNPVGTTQQYPGVNDQAAYSEALLVGYRWFDAKGVAPQFPFGHGLSYTTFLYSNLQITGLIVSFDVKNTGMRAGQEVAQLYLGFPSSAGEPPKSLKAFQKTTFAAGATVSVKFTLSDADVSVWDATTHAWKVVSGTFNVYIGSSSRDIRLTGSMMVKK